MRFERILCLADVGGTADQAMREAGELARRNDADLTFLYIEPGDAPSSVLFPHQHERSTMERPRLFSGTGALYRHAAATTGLDEKKFSVAVEMGKVNVIAVMVADETDCDLLVTPALPFCERIVRAADCTVLIVRENEGFGVLAATDFSDRSLPALRAGKMFARWSGQPLTTMYSLDFPQVPAVASGAAFAAGVLSQNEVDRMRSDARRHLESALTQVHARGPAIIEHGPAADAIIRTASRLNCRLVVVGSHRKGVLPRILLGSVAEHVAQHATRSVLVVRRDGDATKREAA